jgi:uncharacterized integral membrane protein
MNDQPNLPAAASERPIVVTKSGVSPALVGLGVFAVLAVLFILQNRERTSIDFLFFELHSRTWTAIAVAMVLGAILDRLGMTWWRRRKAAQA